MTFTSKTDEVDIIHAADIDALQDAVTAVTPQTAGGLIVGGQGEVGAGGPGTYLGYDDVGHLAPREVMNLELGQWDPITTSGFSTAAASSFENAWTKALAAAATRGRQGTMGARIVFPAGVFWTRAPLQLPRTDYPQDGGSGNAAIQLEGEGIDKTTIAASASAWSGTELIGWQAPGETARTAHWQRIANLSLWLPNVTGVSGIHHAKLGTYDTSQWSNYLSESLFLALENVKFLTHNSYHPACIQLDVNCRFSGWHHVINDAGCAGTPAYSTLLVKTISQNALGQDPPNFSDSIGLCAIRMNGVYAGYQRGGYARLIEGRLYRSVIDTGFLSGAAYPTHGAEVELVNAWGNHILNLSSEGRGAPLFRLTRCQQNIFEQIGLGTPNPVDSAWQPTTAYSVGQRVTGRQLWALGSGVNSVKYLQCAVAGTSGTTEPIPGADGTTVADGGVTWTVMGDAIAAGFVLIDSTDNWFRMRSGVKGNEGQWSRLGGVGVPVVSFQGSSDRNRCDALHVQGTGNGSPTAEIQFAATGAFNVASGTDFSAGVGTHYVLGADPVLSLFGLGTTTAPPIETYPFGDPSLIAGSFIANRALFKRIRIPAGQPPTYIRARIYNGGTVAGNVDIGIFSWSVAASTVTRITSTGPTALVGSNQTQDIPFTAPFTPAPGGVYYIAHLVTDGTYTPARVSQTLTQPIDANSDIFSRVSAGTALAASYTGTFTPTAVIAYVALLP